MRPTFPILVVLAALTLAVTAPTGTAKADIVSSQYSLEATPSVSSAAVSAQFTVTVGIFHSAAPYQAVQWDLAYHPGVVSLVSVATSPGTPASCLSSDSGNDVTLGCIDIGGPTLTYSGSAFTVTFRCKTNGTATFQFMSEGTFVALGDNVSEDLASVHVHSSNVTCGSGGSVPLPEPSPPAGDQCTIDTVLTGDSFTCTDGRTVRMLQIDAQDPGQCGGAWAKAALQLIFLTKGRKVALDPDTKSKDAQGRTLAAPLWTGLDGNVYNLSIVMVYVGLAKAADLGDGNTKFLDWAKASQVWASVAKWNMWAPGKTYNGGCD